MTFLSTDFVAPVPSRGLIVTSSPNTSKILEYLVHDSIAILGSISRLFDLRSDTILVRWENRGLIAGQSQDTGGANIVLSG